MNKLVLSICGVVLLAGLTAAATFYVDPNSGSDANSGSADAPWQSIGRTLDLPAPTGAAKAAGEEITIVLKGGDYGSLNMNDITGRPKAAAAGVWTTYKAASGETPVFNNISISYNTPTDVNLRFDGVHILTLPEPAGRAKAAIVPTQGFSINGARNLVYENGKCWGTTYQTHNGMIIVDGCTNITIRRNEIGNCGYGIKFLRSTGCNALYNHIHSLSSSGIKYMAGNKDFLIEGNHMHDQQTWDASHASAISIRSGDVIIRGNIMHDGFTSSGMMLYDSDGSTKYYFTNITFENNLLYDITNVYCLRLYNMVSNIVVRNNTFVGKKNTKNDARYCMNTAISGGGPVLKVYNNICIGISSIGGSVTGNNIMWSCSYNDWTCTLGTNIIKVCSYGATKPYAYFENVFFKGTPDFNASHQKTIDYRLAAGSPAVNFGDASQQPATSLGTIGPDGFIQENGVARDASHHSAGAYEFGTEADITDMAITNLQLPITGLETATYTIYGKKVDARNIKTTGLYLTVDEAGNLVKMVKVR